MIKAGKVRSVRRPEACVSETFLEGGAIPFSCFIIYDF